jgi:protein involved in polysaccharide export with SLBB domain
MHRYLPLFLLAASAIAQVGTISVQGGVARPGAYVFAPDEATILNIIGRAGGTVPGAGAKAIIYRSDDRGVPHEIPLALREILRRRAPDVALQPGDVVYVEAPGTKPPARPVIDDRVIQ